VSSETPYVSAASQAGVLRRAWLDVAGTAAPQLPGLPGLLDERLSDLEAAGALDEPSLLAVAEEASQYALEQGAGEVARALSKRLRRAIYEFLLALDAVNPAELANAPALTPPPAVGSAEPRTPVAFTPADVPGADEPVAVVPPPPPVPLWEAVVAPTVVREVYRTREPEPEPVAEEVVDAVDEMGAEPQAAAAEFAEAESGADFAEAQSVDAEMHAAEVVDAVDAAEQADTEWAEAQHVDAEAVAQNGHAVEADAEAHAVTKWTAAPEGVHADDGLSPEAAAEPVDDVESLTAEAWSPDAAHAVEDTDHAAEFAPETTGDDVAAETFTAADVAPEAVGDFTAEPAAADVAPEAGADFGVHALTAADGASEATEDFAAHAFTAEPTVADASEAAENFAAHAFTAEPAAADVATEAAEEFGAHAFTAEPAAADTVPEAAEHFAAHAFTPEPAAPDVAPDVAPDAVADIAAHTADSATADAAPAAEPHAAETAPAPPAADATPEPWSAPIVELPVAHADDAPQLHVVPPANGAKPPRDLLRVPRQFRRLPPLQHRGTNGSTPEGPVDAPAAALPPAAPHDDDAFGVPSVPWTIAHPPTPEPAAPQAPAAEHDEPEEDMGVPFNPFAFAADADDEDLPRPPALVEEPLHPLPAAAPADQLFIQPLPGNDAPQLWTPGPVPTPDYALPKPPAAAEPFPIAPREGFHLTDPGALDLTTPAGNPFLAQPESQVPADVPPAPPAPEPPVGAAEHGAHAHDDDGAWRVRQSPRAQLLAERMAQKRREEAARAAFEAASFHDDDHGRGRGRKRGKQDEALPDMSTARRQLDEHLRKKRGAEAGALLQRLAQEMGGRDIADLALDAGDRCRALGQSRSATNCYLAAWRADPLYETPLWRLSDVCLNDQEIDLAVGYLERIAELMRSRGDDEGAIGVYRKIAMIAPERQDVRDVIRLAKTTGRLDG